MVGILNRKLRREFRGAALRLLAITGIIAVGVGAYVEMDSCHQNLVDARDRHYARCRMADFWIDLKSVPLAELADIAALPGISELQPRIGFFATVDLEGQTELLNGQVISLPDQRRPILNDIVLKSGGYFSDTRDNEVIVNDAFARKHGLIPGKKIHMFVSGPRQTGAREELIVVGTAVSSEFVYLVGTGSILPDPEHFGVFYLKQRYAQQALGLEGHANQLVGRLTADAARRPDEVLGIIERRLEDHGVLNTVPLHDQPSNRFLGEEIKGLATFTRVLPTIFLAVAAFVLNILMTRWTEQQRTAVGTLKALGYSNAQVFGHFLKFGLVIGLMGGLAGCVLGYFLAEWVTSFYKQFYELPDLHNRFYLGKSLAGLGVSLVFALLGTAQGARGVLRLRPAEAMRPKPPRRGGAILLEHVTWLWSRLGFAWRLGLRDVVRSRARTLAGLFAAAMGTCILITGFMMQEAMVFLVDFQFQRVQRYDLELAFTDERETDARQEIRNLPGVDYAEPVLYVPCTFINGPHRKRGAVNGLASTAWLTTPRDGEGRRVPIPPDGLAVSRALAERLHVSAGETITIRPNKGLRQERPARVAHIIDGYIGMTVYADIAYLNRLIDEEAVVNAVQLQLDGNPGHRREFYQKLKEMPAVESVYSRADTRFLLEEQVIKTQKVIIGILVGFAGVIFFGSLLNASLVSLAERLTEVATLRVLGYGPWEVGGMFLRESMLVNLIGTLAGLPLGYGLATAMVGMYENEMFRIPVVFTAQMVAKTLIASVVFALLAHAFIQRSIHKMDWLEALKVKE